jgi:hypothetical protein
MFVNNQCFISFSAYLILESFDLLLEFSLVHLEFLVVGLELLDVGITGRSKSLLDEFNCVSWLLGLLVEANEHLGQLIDDASLLEVLSEFFLLLLGSLLLERRLLEYLFVKKYG